MTRAPIQMIEPKCIECGKISELKTGAAIWPNRTDLADIPIYLCTCGAYVGVHRGTDVPLGYPAGPRTRAARKAAHAEFDLLWEAKIKPGKVTKGAARGLGYAWLAKNLGIEPAACHIAHFDEATCRRVVAICKPFADRIREARRQAQAVYPI